MNLDQIKLWVTAGSNEQQGAETEGGCAGTRKLQ